MIASDAETLGKRRLSADPRRERGANSNSNINDSIGNYQSSKSSKQGTTPNAKFNEQKQVYSSLQALPKPAPLKTEEDIHSGQAVKNQATLPQ